MIHAEHLLQALREKIEEFSAFEEQESTLHEELAEDLAYFQATPLPMIEARLDAEEWPGARPTKEFLRHNSIHVPFASQFAHHQDARTWAASVLEGNATFAVDGSQLMPSKEVSVPVSVVQAGWFWNPHQRGQSFEKQVVSEVIGPQELLASGSEEKLFHDQYISLRRYQEEIVTFCELLARAKEQAGRPVGFFDGSLLVSFAEVLKEFHRNKYLEAATDLLARSEATQVPLVGFVDTSLARDLIRMLRVFHEQPMPDQQDGLRDATMLESVLSSWGDRTIAFVLARPGIQREYGDYAEALGFVYMRTSMEQPPARIEFPLWIYQAGLLDHVMDMIRAELVVGNGYPYTLETADQVAWFSPQDRSRFVRLLQAFLQENDLSCHISNKLRSKQRRR